MIVGTEWIVEAEGCAAERLRDLDRLRGLCDEVVADLDLCVVGKPVWHQFPWPAGITGLYLLGESHLACHSYPEYGLATFNLYCCRSQREWPWCDRLASWLAAEVVRVRSLARGGILLAAEAPR
jgi:S-adenosylmethionine decarboxylase